MMTLEGISLARQVDVALEKLGAELKGMTAGTIVLQIRDDSVGRFGIRHLPVDCIDQERGSSGLSSDQVLTLRKLAVEALKHKSSWTHGEISYDFVLKQSKVFVSVQFESNYNMANLMFRYSPKKRDRKGASNE
ncbi:O-methyltransferase [Cohnella cholangitidis]|uniref:O-methyltransferase n=1 Tax=Cohnella cholangitidis TaxID=2598458 RepID=A0A7G5BVE1_9BACL|nr:O-methyltransferase [Cohnella cholangitidis]QMV40925.1 O-methyltransferase [Cohnella cholangitidis]